VLDYDMPKTNGIECALKLMVLYNQYKIDPPEIVIMTAYNCAELDREAIKIGIGHIYSKPMNSA